MTLVSWVCCELTPSTWDFLHLHPVHSPLWKPGPLWHAQGHLGKCVAMAGTKPDLPKCPRLLTCPSTALCSKGDLLARDGKERCPHLFIHTNLIPNIFSMCLTWNSSAIPHRSVLICREGMVLSEYGAFIPWTYFLQDVRLCNPAKLWAWLPLEKADSFSAFFLKIYHPPWAFVLSVCRWIDC